MKIVIVIPTYNEAGNISRLIPKIYENTNSLNHDVVVLVVDGNSPDGTANVVTDLSSQYPNVQLLLEKQKNGLGAAYIYGFKHAINELGADVVIEMDGDFQHDPKDLPRLIKKIEEGYDYAIGSRFTKGGSIPKDWEFHRKFLSIGGNIFSKLVLGMYKVNDFTTGFKASRVDGFLNKIDLDSILSKGFAYKIDLLYKMHNLGAKIVEVPIDFGLRDRGDSKMEKNNAIDSLRVVVMLRFNHSKSFFKFVIVGFVGLFTDLTLSNLFRLLLTLAPNLAASLAAVLAMCVTFTLNNFWSFGDRPIIGVKKKVFLFVTYIGVSFVPILVRYFVVGYIVNMYGNTLVWYNFGLFISILFGLVWNYTFYSRLIWKRKDV